MTERTLSLFEGYGIEIESVVVDAETLDVRSIVDEVLRDADGGEEFVEDVDDGPIGWSNELVTHVVELKTNGPVPSFEGVAGAFLQSSKHLSKLLEARGARLLPTGMHPWMDPVSETRIWPHEHGPVYGAYDRLFDCHRHGWSNLQSVHLNLPFANEEELGRLLAASRLVLPLIPALAASSPIVEGEVTGKLDNRLEVYRTNSARVRAMTGDVIPEPVYTYDGYRETVFAPLDRELEAIGADPVLLGQEWTNARGAIVRFDRMAVEIRLIDAQECAASDLAVAAAVAGLVRAHVEERWISHAAQRDVDTQLLYDQLVRGIADGPDAALDGALAAAFGSTASATPDARSLLRAVVEDTTLGSAELERPLEVILRDGTLAERILRALGDARERSSLRHVYRSLCDCLVEGRAFVS